MVPRDEELPEGPALRARGGGGEAYEDGEDDEGEHVLFRQDLGKVRCGKGLHDLLGRLEVVHLHLCAEIDREAPGRRIEAYPGRHEGRCDNPRGDKDRHHGRHDPAQPLHVGHGSDSRGDGKENERHEGGKEEVQKHVAEGLEKGGPFPEEDA